jgi:hypothetical protein
MLKAMGQAGRAHRVPTSSGFGTASVGAGRLTTPLPEHHPRRAESRGAPAAAWSWLALSCRLHPPLPSHMLVPNPVIRRALIERLASNVLLLVFGNPHK